MQQRITAIEEGKDPNGNLHRTTTQARSLPWRLLLLLAVFLGFCLAFSFISMNTVRRFGVGGGVWFEPSIEPCSVSEPTSLEQWIKAPSNLLHTMTDEELFWRATHVPRMKKYPFPRLPKVAFMFLTKGPLPLSPLWDRFFNGYESRFSIYIHSLPTYHQEFPPSSVFYNRLIPSQVVEWGRMSMCDAEKRLLANALLDINNEWFILVSESCVPLYNFSFVYDYIAKSRHSFVGVFDDPGRDGRGRYNESMAPEVNLTQWRKGAQWFEVSRKLAINIVEDTTFYAKFKEFCRPNCYVDEHYFPTMLHIQAPNALANRSLTFVDWSRGGAHPATFGKSDITVEFLKRVREGHSCVYNGQDSKACFLFARKFSPSALEPLLRVASSVFGY